MNKQISIKDIAKELNIHHTTVSRALRNCESVKKETRELIHKKAREMSYTPNLLAQGFRNRRSNIIGILVPDLQYYLFSKFVSSFTNLASENGYTVMVIQSSDKCELEKKAIDLFVNYRLAGVVCSVAMDTVSAKHFNILTNNNIPIVFFDRIPDDIDVSTVEMDNFQGAYDAVNLMIKMGRSRIAFVSVATLINVFKARLNGYKQALSDNDIPFNEKYFIEQRSHNMSDGYSAAERLMELDEVPDAILAVSDNAAIGVIKFLKNKNVLVPKDISVIGFDNGPACVVCDPELTVIDQPISKLTTDCFDLLINQINGKTTDLQRKMIKCEIIFRGSC